MGRQEYKNASTHVNKNIRARRHTTSNKSTSHKSDRCIFQNMSTQSRISFQRSTPRKERVWVGRHCYLNTLTHINGDIRTRRHQYPNRSTHINENMLTRRHYYPTRSTHSVYRLTQPSNRMTHKQKSFEYKLIRSEMGTSYYQNRPHQKYKSHELIYNSQIQINLNKHQIKNIINKLICVKQVWIPKCLLTILDIMKNLNGTKQVWVPKSSI